MTATIKKATARKVEAKPALPTYVILGTKAKMTPAQVRAFVDAERKGQAAAAVAIVRYAAEHSIKGQAALVEALGLSQSTVSRRLSLGTVLYALSAHTAIGEVHALCVEAVLSAYGTMGKVETAIKAAGVKAGDVASLTSWYVSEANRLKVDADHRAKVYEGKVGPRTANPAKATSKVETTKASTVAARLQSVAAILGSINGSMIKSDADRAAYALVRSHVARISETMPTAKAKATRKPNPAATHDAARVLAGVTTPEAIAS